MLAVGSYVAVRAVLALIDRSHPEAAACGVAVAAMSVVVLPFLGWQKLRVARHLTSAALRGDGILTLAAAVLATTTLAAVVVDAALGWWWADALAALVIGTALVVEGARVWLRHRFG